MLGNINLSASEGHIASLPELSPACTAGIITGLLCFEVSTVVKCCSIFTLGDQTNLMSSQSMSQRMPLNGCSLLRVGFAGMHLWGKASTLSASTAASEGNTTDPIFFLLADMRFIFCQL